MFLVAETFRWWFWFSLLGATLLLLSFVLTALCAGRGGDHRPKFAFATHGTRKNRAPNRKIVFREFESGISSKASAHASTNLFGMNSENMASSVSNQSVSYSGEYHPHHSHSSRNAMMMTNVPQSFNNNNINYTDRRGTSSPQTAKRVLERPSARLSPPPPPTMIGVNEESDEQNPMVNYHDVMKDLNKIESISQYMTKKKKAASASAAAASAGGSKPESGSGGPGSMSPNVKTGTSSPTSFRASSPPAAPPPVPAPPTRPKSRR